MYDLNDVDVLQQITMGTLPDPDINPGLYYRSNPVGRTSVNEDYLLGALQGATTQMYNQGIGNQPIYNNYATYNNAQSYRPTYNYGGVQMGASYNQNQYGQVQPYFASSFANFNPQINGDRFKGPYEGLEDIVGNDTTMILIPPPESQNGMLTAEQIEYLDNKKNNPLYIGYGKEEELFGNKNIQRTNSYVDPRTGMTPYQQYFNSTAPSYNTGNGYNAFNAYRYGGMSTFQQPQQAVVNNNNNDPIKAMMAGNYGNSKIRELQDMEMDEFVSLDMIRAELVNAGRNYLVYATEYFKNMEHKLFYEEILGSYIDFENMLMQCTPNTKEYADCKFAIESTRSNLNEWLISIGFVDKEKPDYFVAPNYIPERFRPYFRPDFLSFDKLPLSYYRGPIIEYYDPRIHDIASRDLRSPHNMDQETIMKMPIDQAAGLAIAANLKNLNYDERIPGINLDTVRYLKAITVDVKFGGRVLGGIYDSDETVSTATEAYENAFNNAYRLYGPPINQRVLINKQYDSYKRKATMIAKMKGEQPDLEKIKKSFLSTYTMSKKNEKAPSRDKLVEMEQLNFLNTLNSASLVKPRTFEDARNEFVNQMATEYHNAFDNMSLCQFLDNFWQLQREDWIREHIGTGRPNRDMSRKFDPTAYKNLLTLHQVRDNYTNQLMDDGRYNNNSFNINDYEVTQNGMVRKKSTGEVVPINTNGGMLTLVDRPDEERLNKWNSYVHSLKQTKVNRILGLGGE